MPIDINAQRAAKAAKSAAKDDGKPGSESKVVPTARSSSAPGALPELRTSAKLADVAPNPLNPRKIDVESEDMLELRASLRDRGQMTPVAVVTAEHFRRLFDGTPHMSTVGDREFVICGGGRRYAALEANRAAAIKFTVLHGREAPQSPAEWLAATVTENIQREELSVMETARSVRDLRDYNTGREVAAILRKSDAWVSQLLSLNSLPASVQAVIEPAPFSIRQALSLREYGTERDQLAAARRIAAELRGEPAPPDAAVSEPAAASDGVTDNGATPRVGPKVGRGRKAHSPAQKLNTTLGKLDRDTIVEAMLLRFPGTDPNALVQILTEAEPAAADDTPASV